jgi:hypothetical protein
MKTIYAGITSYEGGFLVFVDGVEIITTSLQKAMALVKGAFVVTKSEDATE